MVRLKYRYCVVQINSNDVSCIDTEIYQLKNIADQIVHETILKNVQKYYGDFGTGAVRESLRIKYINEVSRIAILRIRHGPHRFITSILPLITSLGQHAIRMQILYIGATIIQCKRFLEKKQQHFLNKTVHDIKNPDHRANFVSKLMKLDLDM